MSTLGIFLLAGGSYPTLLPALAGNVLNVSAKNQGGSSISADIKNEEAAYDTGVEDYAALSTANGLGSVVGAIVVASIHSIRSRRAQFSSGLGLSRVV